MFFKDIFGLITVRQERDELTNLLVPVYVNEDYASSRGFEASLIKRFSHKFSGEINYTYSIATGVASDPQPGRCSSPTATGSTCRSPSSRSTGTSATR